MTAPRSLRELFDQIGLQEVPSTDGTVIMEMPVDERVMNTAGGLQGGLIATMADVTAGQLAARSTPFGHGIATTDLFIRYLRPIKDRAGARRRPDSAHRQAVRRGAGRHLPRRRRRTRCDGDRQLRRRRIGRGHGSFGCGHLESPAAVRRRCGVWRCRSGIGGAGIPGALDPRRRRDVGPRVGVSSVVLHERDRHRDGDPESLDERTSRPLRSPTQTCRPPTVTDSCWVSA